MHQSNLVERQMLSVAFVMSSSFKDLVVSNGTWLLFFFFNFSEACFLGEARLHKWAFEFCMIHALTCWFASTNSTFPPDRLCLNTMYYTLLKFKGGLLFFSLYKVHYIDNDIPYAEIRSVVKIHWINSFLEKTMLVFANNKSSSVKGIDLSMWKVM